MTFIVDWAKAALRFGSVSFLVIVLGIGVLLLFLRPRWGRRWIVAITLVYAILSTPLGSSLLVAPLVHGYHSIGDPREAGSPAAIVVLGGGIRELKAGSEVLAYPYESTTLRVLEAARVFRLLEGRAIVVASGGVTDVEQQTPEGEVIADALTKVRIPRDQIIVEDASRTTHEQAMIVTRLLKSRGIERFVLITSPTHISRSVAAFRAQHAEVVPSVAPLLSDGFRRRRFFVPNSDSLEISDAAIYDYAALVYYWARGWLRPSAAPLTR